MNVGLKKCVYFNEHLNRKKTENTDLKCKRDYN